MSKPYAPVPARYPSAGEITQHPPASWPPAALRHVVESIAAYQAQIDASDPELIGLLLALEANARLSFDPSLGLDCPMSRILADIDTHRASKAGAQ